MNELILTEIKYELPTVTYDLTQLRSDVALIKQKYSNLILTENDITDIKKEMAQINKISKALNDQRIAIAKEIKKPITQMEIEINGVVDEIDGVYRFLKNQTDDFAQQEKDKKKADILALPEWVGQYMTFNDEWLKSNYSMAKVKADLAKQRNDFQNQCLLIETTCKSLGLKPDKYYEMLTEHKDITEIVDLITNDKEVKEEYAATTVELVYQTETSITIEDVKDTDIYTRVYQIKATKPKFLLLVEYMKQNNIEWEKM